MTLKRSRILSALIVVLGLILVGPVGAQTFNTLYNFNFDSDGEYPGSLILSGDTFYGTLSQGGKTYLGGVFTLNVSNISSPVYTTLYRFTDDNSYPSGALILSSNTLYGMTQGGGVLGFGTVFALNIQNVSCPVFTTLYSFTNGNDGGIPVGGLVLSSNTLYGIATQGGSTGQGTVFALNIQNINCPVFTILHTFTGYNDGGYPDAGLIISGNILYGTAYNGGTGYGTLFAINIQNINCPVFTILHTFMAGNDGAYPFIGTLSGNTLYGTTSEAYGAIFSLNIQNINCPVFTALFNFTGGDDGGYPDAGLIVSGNTLYGTADYNDITGQGKVFAINIQNINCPIFTTPHNFTGYNDGGPPFGRLIISGNTLYGTTVFGGSEGSGTVFNLSFAPQLTINLSGTNVILSWPTNVDGFDYTGFNLQSTANLSPAAWSAVTNMPVAVNGQYTVTNPVSSAQQFYQLSQQ